MELEQWVRGLGALTIEGTPDVAEKPSWGRQARRQKTRLTVQDLPPETIRLEMDGCPFFVLLRDKKVYMSYLAPSGTACIKGVRPSGAKEAALQLAGLVSFSGCAWPDRSVALACNWPNVAAPPMALIALNKTAPRLTASSATKCPQGRSDDSFKRHSVARTEGAKAMLPSDAVAVTSAGRTCYVLLKENLAFMQVESWDASTAHLREVTDLARKKRLMETAKEQTANAGRAHPFQSFG